MPADFGLTFHQIAVLKDNYVTLIRSDELNLTAVVDVGDPEPIILYCTNKGWKLTDIFITHHHWDHSDGLQELVKATAAKVTAFSGDAHRISPIDNPVKDHSVFKWAGAAVEVMHLPGHTSGTIAYLFKNYNRLFCGDILFLMGCGRLFEGTFDEMFTSLQAIKMLPDDTLICCGHEYTLNNAEFAMEVEPNNQRLLERFDEIKKLRDCGKPTVPATLGIEKLTNPFLRASTLQEFTEIRKKRNIW